LCGVQVLRARRLKLCTVDSAITLRKSYELSVIALLAELTDAALGEHWLRHCMANRRPCYVEHEAELEKLMEAAEDSGRGGSGLRRVLCCFCA
jgi:hypothetical protein